MLTKKFSFLITSRTNKTFFNNSEQYSSNLKVQVPLGTPWQVQVPLGNPWQIWEINNFPENQTVTFLHLRFPPCK